MNESWSDKLSRLAKEADELFQIFWKILHEQGAFSEKALFAKQAWQKAYDAWEEHGNTAP